MSDSQVSVSVVLPTHNRAGEVEGAIRSVLEQGFGDFELLVVDDGSTDDTSAVVEAVSDTRVRLLTHETNRGASAARNTGIRAAEGELIAFLDSDDRWRPDKLERQVRKLRESSPEVGVVYCGTIIPEGPERETPGIVPEVRGNIYEQQLARDWIAGTPTWLVRSECFERAGLFNENLPARNDYEMSIRLAEHCHFEFVEDLLVEVGTASKGRLTEDVHRRLEAHESIIRGTVKPRLSSFSTRERRRILATQYFTGGRYAQRRGHHELARTWLKKSLAQRTLAPKTLVAFGFALLGRDLPAGYYRWAYADHPARS